MVISFSRHARRRAKLYHLPESTIEEILMDADLREGEPELIKDVPVLFTP